MKPALIVRSPVSGVYRVANQATDTLYIGSSCDMAVRWQDHVQKLVRGIHPNRYLQSAWAKHGADVFVFEVLNICEPAQALEREQWWLDFYQSRCPERLYNHARVAGAPMCGRNHTEASKAKISEARKAGRNNMLGRKHSAESRARISAANLGRPHPHKGHKISPETRLKISQGQPRTQLFGADNPFFGKTHTDDVRERISKARRGVGWTVARRLAQEQRCQNPR